MNVKWYYRQSEVPDSVYQHLVQDRNNENGESVTSVHVQALGNTLILHIRTLTHCCCPDCSAHLEITLETENGYVLLESQSGVFVLFPG